jgi:2-oxoglutarate ferredoxin oxidoreductase subunit alpha
MIELDADPKKLISVLNYDGMPITADNIIKQLKSVLQTASQNITSKI